MFHLTLKRAHRAQFFQLKIRQKKRDILSEKRESRIVLKKRESTPESGTVDTYDIVFCIVMDINFIFLIQNKFYVEFMSLSYLENLGH